MFNQFSSIYTHGFLRVAVCVPSVRVADPAFNIERTIALAQQASTQGAALALFPELGISAYLTKPIKRATLMEAVQKYTGTKNSTEKE